MGLMIKVKIQRHTGEDSEVSVDADEMGFLDDADMIRVLVLWKDAEVVASFNHWTWAVKEED